MESSDKVSTLSSSEIPLPVIYVTINVSFLYGRLLIAFVLVHAAVLLPHLCVLVQLRLRNGQYHVALDESTVGHTALAPFVALGDQLFPLACAHEVEAAPVLTEKLTHALVHNLCAELLLCHTRPIGHTGSLTHLVDIGEGFVGTVEFIEAFS